MKVLFYEIDLLGYFYIYTMPFGSLCKIGRLENHDNSFKIVVPSPIGFFNSVHYVWDFNKKSKDLFYQTAFQSNKIIMENNSQAEIHSQGRDLMIFGHIEIDESFYNYTPPNHLAIQFSEADSKIHTDSLLNKSIILNNTHVIINASGETVFEEKSADLQDLNKKGLMRIKYFNSN